MSVKSPVASRLPCDCTVRDPVNRPTRRGIAGRTGARRRCGPSVARFRDTRVRWTTPDERDALHLGVEDDHEIDPAFDEVGDLDDQIDALSARRRRESAWDRFSRDDGPDFG